MPIQKGSLIKHQLVDDPGMEIARLAVLDSLREPSDPKMFMFGATALEQFMDCVLEWPHYFSEILQISHLREAHTEIVSAIEGALANMLSCPTEPKDFPRDITQNKSILCAPLKNHEEKVREMTTKYLMQCDPSEIQKHTSKLLKDLQLSENLILQEKQELFELKSQRLKYPYSECQLDNFEKEYGHIILELKSLPGTNDKKLKHMKDVLYDNFTGDSLLNRVKDILYRNMKVSKEAAVMVSGYYDYFSRLKIEMPWLNEAEKRIKEICGLLSSYSPLFTELERKVSEQSKRLVGLPKELFEPNTLFKMWKDTGLLLKEVVSQTKFSKDLCLVSENMRTILNEKATYAARFDLTEQRLRAGSSKVHQKLVQLCREVEEAEISYKEKMDGLEKASKVPKKYEKVIIDNAMSWRKRKLYERSILAPMRQQGRAMCAFVSTVSMTESLNKRHSAYCSRYSRDRQDEFIIKLSEYHLQDIVTAFYASNKRKGSEKLHVCLERMTETGVVSEDAYDIATTKATGFARYRISDFERLNPTRLVEAFDLLENGNVLVGTFAITKGYFSLGPEDVYDTNNGDEFETSAAGNTLTHAVVIVGYGVTPDNIAYYVFQNSYGPTWGTDGFGCVTCRSIRQLYAANL